MTDKTLQQPVKIPSLIGGAMIVAGTAIGAGMFANPTATAGVWFTGSIILLFYTWFCMYVSGLMLLEASVHYPLGASFNTVVKDLLGSRWNWVTALSLIFVFYVLTYAYIFVGGGLAQYMFQNAYHQFFGSTIEIPRALCSTIFMLVLGFCVWLSTKVVDRFMSLLIGGLVLAFFFSIGGFFPFIQADVLFNLIPGATHDYAIYAFAALPVCLASFGYQLNIPSLVIYYHKNPYKVAKSILLGTVLSLIIYIVWQLAVQGILPRHAFAPVIAVDGDIKVLLQTISMYLPLEGVNELLRFFAFFAISSSFLGVTLGLFDYLADRFKFGNHTLGRCKSALLTFLPPYIACLFFPTGFVHVISFVGLATAFWACIVPALLVKASRQRYPDAKYRVFGGNFMIYFILLFAILNIAAHLLVQFHLIPEFMG